MPRAFRNAAVGLTVTLATAMTAACGDSTGPPVSRMAVLSAMGVSDTILALLPDPLVVLVRDETGAPAFGVPVRFEGLRPLSAVNPYGAFLSPEAGRPGSSAPVIDTTDANGEARVYVQLGTRAGPVQIVADAPSLALSTTASYTVLPGAATRARVEPADSAAYVGRGYALRGAAVDQYGNARSDAVTYTATAPGTVGVDGGGRVTTHAIGRGAIIAATGTLRDTAWVSVVPEGVITAHKYRSSGDENAVVFFALDGSGYEEHPIRYWVQPRPDWAPSGDAIVAESGGDNISQEENRLVMLRRGERTWSLIGGGDAVQGNQFYPQYSPDGRWIYFAFRAVELWRIRPDGSGAERVGPAVGSYHYDSKPSVSPDGKRVVFVSNRMCCAPSLMILDVTTRTVDTLLTAAGLPIHSEMPRWSPTDPDIIAYMDRRIWVTNADGATQRALTPQGKTYGAGIDWSPDGRWIIAHSSDDNTLHLIEVATGLTLPLGFSNGFVTPAWRP
jgi:hypothetical protein